MLRDLVTARRNTEKGYKSPNRKVVHICQEIIDYIGRREAEQPEKSLWVDGAFLFRVVREFMNDEEEKGGSANQHYLTVLVEIRDYISGMELME